jgi:hypothetical protein
MMNTGEYEDEDAESDDEDHRGEKVIRRSPLAKVRKGVRVIRASSKRKDDLVMITENGNRRGIWNIKDNQVLHDVRTRWDSTYSMVVRYLEKRPVCFLFLFRL